MAYGTVGLLIVLHIFIDLGYIPLENLLGSVCEDELQIGAPNGQGNWYNWG